MKRPRLTSWLATPRRSLLPVSLLVLALGVQAEFDESGKAGNPQTVAVGVAGIEVDALPNEASDASPVNLKAGAEPESTAGPAPGVTESGAVDLEAGTSESVRDMAPAQAEQLADRWGIEVVALRSTAAGHFIDFRYKILDAKKAAALMDREAKPVLTHQDTGKRMPVPVPPKVGRLRQTSSTPKVGRHYFMLFANPGRLVKPGDKVTIELGELRVTDLIVEG